MVILTVHDVKLIFDEDVSTVPMKPPTVELIWFCVVVVFIVAFIVTAWT